MTVNQSGRGGVCGMCLWKPTYPRIPQSATVVFRELQAQRGQQMAKFETNFDDADL